MAMGMPTFLERPATTTFFPSVGIPERREFVLKLIKKKFRLQPKRKQVIALWLFTCAFNNFPDSPGCGREHGGLIQAHAAHVYYVEAVHVLGWGNCITDCALIYVTCQENKDRLQLDLKKDVEEHI